jgi:hypothetical protein
VALSLLITMKISTDYVCPYVDASLFVSAGAAARRQGVGQSAIHRHTSAAGIQADGELLAVYTAHMCGRAQLIARQTRTVARCLSRVEAMH